MSVPVLVAGGPAGPTVRIRGAQYPVLLPSLRDARLHLALVIVSLQVLGQVAFDFRLSIAQILVALGTCGVLESGIAFHRRRVILWPASALLTGNGVAFILRVPGTEHGDWWSLHGAWIFAGTAAVALLSKHVIRFRGRHLFNPSNIGLVLCFLAFGSGRAEPLDFWWAPMSPWLALALALIVAGGLAILLRLGLLAIAVGFWVTFALGIGVLALSGHQMTARWHLGPITGAEFWWVLVSSPEILVFLFFMITDPKTVPVGRGGRHAYAIAVGLLAVLAIAPQTTEYWSKVAVLGALAIVCAVWPFLDLLAGTARLRSWRGVSAARPRRTALGATAVAGVVGLVALIFVAGIPARPSGTTAGPPAAAVGSLPEVTVMPSPDVASRIDRPTALRIARDVIADLRIEADALRRRDAARASAGVDGARLAELARSVDAADGHAVVVPTHRLERMRVTLERSGGQGPPLVVASLSGTVDHTTWAGSPPTVRSRTGPARFEATVELTLREGRYLIVGSRGARADAPLTAAAPRPALPSGLARVRLENVAKQVGLDFRHGSFRYQVTADPVAMMGGGLCWLDIDNDGWLDLYAVNSYSEADFFRWERDGGLPRNALFRNVRGRFEDVSRRSGADLSLRGNGCVAADFDLDGDTDLFVTGAANDALLWNDGDGTFTEGARAAGITSAGWHAGAAVGDVDGDGWPDLFVAGYTEVHNTVPGSAAGFPTNRVAVRDRLYLSNGPRRDGRVTFREVGERAGIERTRIEHGLGAVLTDLDGDGRIDLYVANDADPNRLYVNVPWPGGAKADPEGLGFRFRERARRAGADDPNAGMGIAAADYSADGRPDLFVTNSHKQLHAVFRSRPPATGAPSFSDARSSFAAALDTRLAGWGASWADLDLDGDLDLVVANGAIPVTDLAKDAEPIQAFANLGVPGRAGQVREISGVLGLAKSGPVIGRGLAAADYDNDGDLDIAVSSIGGRLILLRASGAAGHWLEVRLSAFVPGATVTAVLPDGRRLVRDVKAGSSYLSSEDPRVHLGLGTAVRVRELVVRLPGGRETRLSNVAVDRVIVIES